MKPVIRRRRAKQDAEEAASYYVAEAGDGVAESFIAAVEHALDRIAHYPASGTLRYAHIVALPGLRAWPLKHFPYLIFYIDHDDRVDVWRVLRHSPDIEALPSESGNS